jgi:hypothetical protein
MYGRMTVFKRKEDCAGEHGLYSCAGEQCFSKEEKDCAGE